MRRARESEGIIRRRSRAPFTEETLEARRERGLCQDRDGKHSPPPAPAAPDEPTKLPVTITEHHTTRYQEVDEVIWDLSRTKDVALHRKYFSHTNALFLRMRAKSVGTISVPSYAFCSYALGAKTAPKLSARSDFSRIYGANLPDS